MNDDKIIASFLVTLTVGFFAFWSIVPSLAVYPPRLTLQSAMLAPLAHIAVKAGWPPWAVLVITLAPVYGLGFFIGVSWVRQHLFHALRVSGILYLIALAAAFLVGVAKQ